MDARPGTLSDAIEARLDRLERDRIVERIWAGDHTVWRDDPAEIADRLGWLRLPTTMRAQVDDVTAFAERARADGFTRAVLCGMGGSSLAPEVMARTLGPAADGLPLRVLDTTHPAAIRRALGRVDGSLFLIASKSGGTIETLSQLAAFWEAAAGDGSRFVAITDPGSALAAAGRERGFREVFSNPPDVGGRFSALSLFGLVPAALLGIDVGTLLAAAAEAAERCGPSTPVRENPGAVLGVMLGVAAAAGRDKATLLFEPGLSALGDWAEQLVAESTGKDGRGILPIVGEPLREPAAYGADRVFVAGGEGGGVAGLEEAGHPVVHVPTMTLGADFFVWEFATAIAGHVLGVHPFDQPNVAGAKTATTAILEGDIDTPTASASLDDIVTGAGSGDYIAIQAFCDPTPALRERLEAARAWIGARTHAPVTVGLGPRYLHSTGQIHKGGPARGRFIQVRDDPGPAVAIPGEAFDFGTLLTAQADGDMASLIARGRPVARVDIDELPA